MNALERQLRALVAVQSDSATAEKVRQQAFIDARQFAAEPLDLSDAWVFALPPPNIDAPQRAFDLAQRIYETTSIADATATMVVHVDAGDSSGSTLLREILQLRIRGGIIVTDAAARRLAPEQQQILAPYRTPDRKIVFLWPEGDKTIELERLKDWLPPIGRYVVECALSVGPSEPAEPPQSDLVPPGWLKRGLLQEEIAKTSGVHIRDVHELARRSGVQLVVGPPWIGKTFVAAALRDEWSRHGSQFVSLISIGRDPVTAPSWWDKWRSSDLRALWLLDGADEVARPDLAVGKALEHYGELAESERARISLIVFQREDFSLAQTLKISPLAGGRHYRLLPMDERQATQALHSAHGAATGAELLERALSHLEKLDALRLAPNARVLRAAAALEEDVSSEQLWGRVLTSLFESRRPGERADVSPTLLRDLAARLAAVALVSGHKEVATPGSESVAALQWANVFEGESFRDSQELLRSAVLSASPLGAIFAERNTQELLAAWALRDLEDEPLRHLLTDNEGSLVPGLSEVADHISALKSNRSSLIGRWRTTTPLPLSLAAAEGWLDRALQVASGPLGFAGRAGAVRRLAALEAIVPERLHAPHLSERAKELLLEISSINRWSGAVEPAIEIALMADSTKLRPLATSLVCDVGTDDEVDRLQQLLHRTDASQELAQSQATVLLRLLGRKTIPWLLERAPAPDPDLGDSRSYLLYRMEERLSLDDSLFILSRLYEGDHSSSGSPSTLVLKELEEPAARILFREWNPAVSQHVSLVAAVLKGTRLRDRWGYIGELDDALRRRPEARRALYEPLLGEGEHWRVWNRLTSKDLGWLLAFAQSSQSAVLSPKLRDHVLQDVYRLARGATSSEASYAMEWLNREHSDFLAAQGKREEEQRAHDQELEELRERLQEDERTSISARRSLSSFASEVLDGDLDERSQLDWLGEVVAEKHHLEGVDGRFSELSDDLQGQVIRRIRQLLPKLTPTPTPDGSSFPWRLWEEAQAFRTAVMDASFWLEPDLIRRWLPGTLYVSSSERTEVVRRCRDLDPEATREAVLEEVRRDARRGQVSVARCLPEEMWDEQAIRSAIEKLVRDVSFPPLARAQLLRLFARRSLDRRLGELSTRLAGDLVRKESDVVAFAAIDVLLAIAPSEGICPLRERVQYLQQADEALSGLKGYGADLQYSWHEWESETLLVLAEVLCGISGLSWESPPLGPRSYGKKDRFRELRDNVLGTLAARSEVDLDALVALTPSHLQSEERAWFGAIRQRRAMAGLLRELEVPPRTAPKVELVIQTLDRSPVLWVRSIQDVFAAVPLLLSDADDSQFAELVLPIPQDRPYDHADGARHEAALQAYVLLRLHEGFRRSAPATPSGSAVSVSREPLEKRGDRPDFVISLGFEKDRLPIEVKWAHTGNCIDALSSQLGERYVVQQGLTHGVYVVGFTSMSEDEFKTKMDKLYAARDKFVEAQANSVRIAIVPLRFRLSRSRPKSEARKKRASPKARGDAA